MDARDSFIGSTFPTPKGGVLTVTGVHKDRAGTNLVYYTECDICIKDGTLHNVPFTSTRANLVKGCIPCGCSKSTKYTKRQYTVLVGRRCKEEGLSFTAPDKWVGGKTLIKLLCNSCGRCFYLAVITLLSGSGCTPCRSDRAKELREIETVNNFISSGKFLEETIITKNTWRTNKIGTLVYWDFICPVCSSDTYVTNGLCGGVFISQSTGLMRGKPPCRCGDHFHWTQEQREHQVKSVCKDEGLTFIGWEKSEGYKNKDSKFYWLCNKGHECLSTISNFINSGRRCVTCSRLSGTGNGYYPERAGEKDFLYLMDFIVSTKVGRSFNIKNRQGGLKRKSCLTFNPKVLQSYTAVHQVIFDTEQAIHAELRERGFQYNCDFTNECFTKDCWYVLQEILEDYVSSGTLVRVT